MKELASLLLSRSLLLPALKLLVDSQDATLQALALEQITTVTQVRPAGRPVHSGPLTTVGASLHYVVVT